MASYSIVSSADAVLSQLQRLVGNGYYFYFMDELKTGKDPTKLDEKLIDKWDLNRPYWKREKRRRGKAPSIWYLRYGRVYLLIATHGKSQNGEPHPFFLEYENTYLDIRKTALNFHGYTIRYPVSKETGRPKFFVRLDKEAYLAARDEILRKSISARYRTRETLEASIRSLPYQWYRPVREQVKRIVREANKRRRYAGFAPIKMSSRRWTES